MSGRGKVGRMELYVHSLSRLGPAGSWRSPGKETRVVGQFAEVVPCEERAGSRF